MALLTESDPKSTPADADGADGSPPDTFTIEQPFIKLWLDDVRAAPRGWQRAHTAPEALAYIASGKVTHASLDHDLGSKVYDGTWLVRAMATTGHWPTEACYVHSANPAGAARMKSIIDMEGPYGKDA